MFCSDKQYLERIHKIAGQVQGLETMFGEKRSAQEIIQQIVVARASLSSLATFVVEAEVKGCLPSDGSATPVARLVESLFKVT